MCIERNAVQNRGSRGEEVDAHIRTSLIVTREDSSPRGAIERGNDVVPIVHPLRPPSRPFVPRRAILTFSRELRRVSILVARCDLRRFLRLHVWITKATQVDGAKLKKETRRSSNTVSRSFSRRRFNQPRLCRSLLHPPPTKRQRDLAGRLVLPNRRRRIARGYCFSRIHKVAEIQSLGEVHRMNHRRGDRDREVIKCRYY